MQKKFWLSLVLSFGILAICSGPAWGLGWYNWYGGYSTATATGWNGGGSVSWSYNPSGWGWGWGGNAYVSTYTNTYPAADSHQAWGWAGASTQSHSSAPGRTADAYASAYNASWAWWNSGGYSYANAQTSGSPSYATAYARANSNWWYQYWVPRTWWYNSWVPYHSWYVPFYANWYYWGWLDGDSHGMDMETNLSAQDTHNSAIQALLNDGFVDNGDGTFTQLGTTLNPADLVYDSNVGGTGHAGWDIIGHDGSQNGTPYSLPFLMSVQQVGGDNDNILLEADFTIDGYIGQVPEPSSIALLAIGIVALGAARRRFGRTAR